MGTISSRPRPNPWQAQVPSPAPPVRVRVVAAEPRCPGQNPIQRPSARPTRHACAPAQTSPAHVGGRRRHSGGDAVLRLAQVRALPRQRAQALGREPHRHQRAGDLRIAGDLRAAGDLQLAGDLRAGDSRPGTGRRPAAHQSGGVRGHQNAGHEVAGPVAPVASDQPAPDCRPVARQERGSASTLLLLWPDRPWANRRHGRVH
jgi:hypothetical protein